MITGCGGKETTCSRRSISGSQPVDERHQQRHPWVQRAVVAAEPLDDPGSRLRNDPHSPRERDQQEDDYHSRDDRSNHSLAPVSYSMTSAVAPLMSTTSTLRTRLDHALLVK